MVSDLLFCILHDAFLKRRKLTIPPISTLYFILKNFKDFILEQS
jgi:hypothetical protein